MARPPSLQRNGSSATPMPQDVTPDKMLDATLLVRRMGHDFNNLFSIVLGGLSLLREEVDEKLWNPDAREVYDDIVSATREAAEVVAQLTAWAGRQALEPERCDLNALARELEPLLRRALPAGVTLEVRTVEDTLEAWCDRARLQDAVIELVANARQAVNDEGSIVVATGAAPGCAIGVTDTGTGMSQKVLEACREPYFTTHQASGRRGLGLCVVDGFARASGGRLTLASHTGEGTRAVITLPAQRPPGPNGA